MTCSKLFLALASAALLVALASAYSKGAPEEVCGDMVPQHPGAPMKTPPPYSVTVDKRNIGADEIVQVTLAGKGGKKFKGFMVQARVGDEPLGSFEKAAEVNLVDCGSSKQTAATHVNSDDKQKITLRWRAPKGLSETVRFNTTIVQNGKVYWVGVLSPRVQVGKSSTGRQTQRSIAPQQP